MDVLSNILETVRFSGCLYFTTSWGAPWGIEVPAHARVARFHLAMRGQCWVRIDGVGDPVLMETGDLIVIPHGARHILSDTPTTPVRSLDMAVKDSGFDGQGCFVYGDQQATSSARMVCGHFAFDEALSHPVLAHLPPYILVRGEDALAHSWFDSALKFMSLEAQAAHPGQDVVLKKLAEILFIQTIRAWQANRDGPSGFLFAIADRHLGRALAAFHASPAQDWTLAGLALEAGLSRTVFAERFRAATGLSAMVYVTDWRMRLAQRLLTDGTLSVDAVADQVGYQSLAAFSRTFKKVVGMGPGAYARERRTEKVVAVA